MRKSADNESTCSAAQRKRGFSLRRLLSASHLLGHRSPRASIAGSGKAKNSNKEVSSDARSANSAERASGTAAVISISEPLQTSSRSSVCNSNAKTSSEDSNGLMECPICLAELPPEELPELSGCGHRSCFSCLQQYLRIEISESRINIACPECSEPIHPNEIRSILADETLYEKYEDFMVRRVLAVDPDTRWCPAPDCSFAVIAAGCASCPKIKCERPGCSAYFCYHCKAEWHPNQTCDAARAQRSPNVRSSSVSFSQESQHRDDIKPCPRCQVLIVKMDDGSCNHMMCAVCGAEFCWLCMKEISDLHYLSPSGCTFWGKKPWSRKKKILWQLGTLAGAPVGIALLAGIAVPAMIIGIPVWVGRKLYTRYRRDNKHKRNAAIVGGAIASVLISPVLAGLAVGIGVPILLFYVYGVVPVSLCRSGGCGVSTTATGVKFEFDDENDVMSQMSQAKNMDNTSIDAASHRGVNPSIGEASLSMVSGSQVLRLGHEADRESASNVAMVSISLAGSIGSSSAVVCQRLEVQADVASTQRFSLCSETASGSISEKSINVSMADDGAASTRALAGSVLNYCKANGSETCSCLAVSDDCSSERVRFDDNVNFIAPNTCNSPYGDKASINSGCSFRNRNKLEKNVKNSSEQESETFNSDSIYIDLSANTQANPEEEKPKKMTASEILRSVFFRFTPTEDKVVSEGKTGCIKENTVFASIQDPSIAHSSNFKMNINNSVVENSSL